MALETVSRAPAIGDFTPLSEHQEATPVSFFGAKPVLHLHAPNAKIKISRDDLATQAEIAALGGNNTNAGENELAEIDNVDVWVTSRSLLLFSQTNSTGVQIPYQSIVVHAQEGSAVLLGLNLSHPNTPDEGLVFVQLRIIPTTVADISGTQDQAEEAPAEPNGHDIPSPTQALFKAISDCQELNPDPPQDGGDDEDEEFDETAPGATGWITSENMQDFLGDDGEFRLPAGMTVVGAADEGQESGLGEGAGQTRTISQVDGGEEDGDEEAKWQRTG